LWENEYNESFNGKLRDELLNGEIFTTLLKAKVLIENWRKEYNQFRPHRSLNYQPPAPETINPKVVQLTGAGQIVDSICGLIILSSFSSMRGTLR